MDKIALFIARLGIAGHAPVAQGTVASVLAVALAPFVYLPLSYPWRLTLLSFIYVLGAWSSERAEALLGRKDPREACIDELFGMWLALFWSPVSASSWELLAALCLFRVFDIFKPWPIYKLEAVHGGHGMMLDDAAAGLVSAALLSLF